MVSILFLRNSDQMNIGKTHPTLGSRHRVIMLIPVIAEKTNIKTDFIFFSISKVDYMMFLFILEFFYIRPETPSSLFGGHRHPLCRHPLIPFEPFSDDSIELQFSSSASIEFNLRFANLARLRILISSRAIKRNAYYLAYLGY